MTSLQDIAEVVIGVDTHVATHSAAVLDSRTGGVLGEITVTADAGGYQELIGFAGQHSGLRAWAVEGTGGHGAGLARLLAGRGELVVELDRPERAQRRNGAKSDPLDAIRAAREALSRADCKDDMGGRPVTAIPSMARIWTDSACRADDHQGQSG